MCCHCGQPAENSANQNRPQKTKVGREKLAAVRPPFLAKSGQKPAEKKFDEKDSFFLVNLSFFDKFSFQVSLK
jgi:hypothetical protein